MTDEGLVPAEDLAGDDLNRISSLQDPTRRRLYEHVAASAEPVTRDNASAALGLQRSLVAYHLDKLVAEGLLVASFFRPHGRGGPGAGRPTKHYERSPEEVSVSLPPRDYGLLADLLARALQQDASGSVRQVLAEVAAEHGRGLAGADQGWQGDADDAREALLHRLDKLGYEPFLDEGTVRLRNCPFHQLAREHTDMVCGMNLALLRGLAEGLTMAGLTVDLIPRLDPGPDRCCVAFSAG